MLLRVAGLTNHLDLTQRLCANTWRGDEYGDGNDACQDFIEFREMLDLRKKFLEKCHTRTGAGPKKDPIPVDFELY